MALVNKETRLEIVEELRNFCYICHKQFFLMCGEPQIKIGGCCSGAEWGKTRYIRPVYAHPSCFQAKEVKRKQTIFKLPVIKKIMRAYAGQELKTTDKWLNKEGNSIFRGLLQAERKKYKQWMRELK
jgi:hypothetical protein